MADIFVSYRRGDSAGHTGRLVDHLERHFGRSAVFQDVQSIEAGRRWDQVISEGVGRCRVLVAVIGREWLAAGGDGQRRIDHPQDYLRQEIASALERGVPVVPVLVEGASMPGADQLPDDLKPLVQWQAHEMSDSRWEYDAGRLMSMLERATGMGPKPAPDVPAPAPAGEGGRGRLAAAAAVVVALVAGGAWFLRPGASPTEAPPPGTTQAGDAPADQAAVAPARFDGNWHDEEAATWGIRQQGDQVEINHTAPGSGTAIGYAQGKVSGRTINFDYVVMVPEEPHLQGELVLSEDGKRLTGVLSNVKEGGNTRVVLHRRDP